MMHGQTQIKFNFKLSVLLH